MATTLKTGDRGELVKRLQAALISLSYDLGPDGADGAFGDRTKVAVESFQDARGLPITGVADPATIAALDLDPATLEDLIELDTEQSTGAEPPAMTVVATGDGDDVYLDPPVRLWPQYDKRWRHERIAGPKTGRLLDWVSNGCNASVAAMTLRWFAEDCTAGTIPFPTKPGGSIAASWYGLRMGEAFWPNADPPGKVELTPEGSIHFRKLYSVAAHYLKTGEIQRNEKGDVVDPTRPQACYVTQRPSEGWLNLHKDAAAGRSGDCRYRRPSRSFRAGPRRHRGGAADCRSWRCPLPGAQWWNGRD
jgi:hypothetical protein